MSIVNIVCASLIEKDGKFLFVQESKEIAKGKYNLPAGRMEFGESLIECVVRETKEETGLDVKVKKLVGIYQRPRSSENSNTTAFCFYCVISAGQITLSKEHPKIWYVGYQEVQQFANEHRLRARFIPFAIDDFRNEQGIDPSWVKVIW